MKVKDIINFELKTKIQARSANADGKYVFFTSSEDESKRYNEYSFDNESIIMGTGGNATLHYYNGKCAVSTDCLVLKTKNGVETKYLYYFFKKNIKILQDGFKGAGLKHTNKEYIGNIYINALPDIQKQKEIVNKIDNAFNVITVYQSQLKKFDLLIKSRFVEMFGDINKYTTLNRYILELRSGKSLAGKQECKNKVLKTGAATFGEFDATQYKYLPIEYTPLNEHKVEDNDVIISRMNTPDLVGACSYVRKAPENMYYPDRLWKVILNNDTNPIFLWKLLWDKDIRKEIKENSSGTSGTMHNISKPKLLSISCIDVPIELQNDFAYFVDQVDKSKFVEKPNNVIKYNI